jgi:hypothetical protein
MKKIIFGLFVLCGISLVHADQKVSTLNQDTFPSLATNLYAVEGSSSQRVTIDKVIQAGATYYGSGGASLYPSTGIPSMPLGFFASSATFVLSGFTSTVNSTDAFTTNLGGYNSTFIDGSGNKLGGSIAGSSAGGEFYYVDHGNVVYRYAQFGLFNEAASFGGNSGAGGSVSFIDGTYAVNANGIIKGTSLTGRMLQRVVTTSQSTTPTINTDNTDIALITGLNQAITSMTTNLSGTPVHGDKLEIDIVDDGTPRAISWGAKFGSTSFTTLPTITQASTMLRVLLQWNSINLLWECLAAG